MTRALLLAWLVLACGCGVDLGLVPGVETGSGHAVVAGRLAMASRLGMPINDQGILVGTTFENRAEQDVGARWDGGLMLGYGTGPAAIDGLLGFEAYAEFGTPLRATLFDHGSLYFGGVVDMPIRISARRQVDDLNESTWLLRRGFELVPLARVRVFRDRPNDWRVDIAGGLSLRLRVFTDLF